MNLQYARTLAGCRQLGLLVCGRLIRSGPIQQSSTKMKSAAMVTSL